MIQINQEHEQKLLGEIYENEHTKQYPESEIIEEVINVFNSVEVVCEASDINFVQFPQLKDLPMMYTALENTFLEGYSKFFKYLPKFEQEKLAAKKDKMENVRLAFKKFFGLCVNDSKVYVIKNPTILKVQNNNFSSLEGPAIQFLDETTGKKYSAYYYHGIALEPYMINTPIEELTKEQVFGATEDQQRAMIARMTPEQTIKFLDCKEIESAFGYTLLSMKYGDVIDAKFVKMSNPSTKDLHIEAVEENIDNLLDAMLFREGIKGFPRSVDGVQVDPDGLYDKQGDIVILKQDSVPSNAVLVDRDCVSNTDLIRHKIEGNYKLYDIEEASYIDSVDAVLVHPEHNDVTVGKGVFKLYKTQVWDYKAKMKRPVID